VNWDRSLPQWYAHSVIVCCRAFSSNISAAVFGLLSADDPRSFKTLPDVFEEGLKTSRNKPFLGHREIVSKDPLRFADRYTWQTYEQIDVRRRNVGSAVHTLFKNGALSGENGLDTIGIWAPNRPGKATVCDTLL
jgi:long-chain acyl-CoA synthetase